MIQAMRTVAMWKVFGERACIPNNAVEWRPGIRRGLYRAPRKCIGNQSFSRRFASGKLSRFRVITIPERF
jgi:hypothetical protein